MKEIDRLTSRECRLALQPVPTKSCLHPRVTSPCSTSTSATTLGPEFRLFRRLRSAHAPCTRFPVAHGGCSSAKVLPPQIPPNTSFAHRSSSEAACLMAQRWVHSGCDGARDGRYLGLRRWPSLLEALAWAKRPSYSDLEKCAKWGATGV